MEDLEQGGDQRLARLEGKLSPVKILPTYILVGVRIYEAEVSIAAIS